MMMIVTVALSSFHSQEVPVARAVGVAQLSLSPDPVPDHQPRFTSAVSRFLRGQFMDQVPVSDSRQVS